MKSPPPGVAPAVDRSFYSAEQTLENQAVDANKLKRFRPHHRWANERVRSLPKTNSDRGRARSNRSSENGDCETASSSMARISLASEQARPGDCPAIAGPKWAAASRRRASTAVPAIGRQHQLAMQYCDYRLAEGQGGNRTTTGNVKKSPADTDLELVTNEPPPQQGVRT